MGKHLPAIDGLRAVAVLSVVAYHAGFPAGFVGVDVFFVISGYLITRQLMEDGDLPSFYARRARRILPAAFLVILVTLGLSFLLLPSVADVARSAAAAGVFVANVYFQSVTGSYWSPDAASFPLLHLWSLSVEEQFYLLWPFVLMVAARRRSALWWVFSLSLGLYAWLSYADPNAAFYQMPARAWELAAGALVSRHRGMKFDEHWGIAGVAIVLLACLVPMPIPLATVVGVFGATMVCAAVHTGSSVPMLQVRPLVWIGLVSYSFYLWHWPLLALDRAVRVGDTPLSARLALVAIAFVLAVVSYRYVEQPFRKARIRPIRAVAVGVACAAAVSCTALVMANARTRTGDDPVAFAAERDQPSRACHATGFDPPEMKCKPKARTLVWGDSMAYAWMPAFPGADQATRDACPPAVGYVPHDPKPGDLKCRAFNDAVLPYAQRADVVVLVWWSLRRTDVTPLKATLENLRGVGRIVIVGPTPVMRDNVPKCIRAGVECGVSRVAFDAEAKQILTQLRALTRQYRNVDVVDVTDAFCTDRYCPAVGDRGPLYWDTHHVSVSATSSLDLLH